MKTIEDTSSEAVREVVREGYARIAKSGGACCGPGACGSGTGAAAADALAHALGYDPETLTILPEGANLGLSCGNPVALASLRPGDVVVDLGSGAGFDVFIAGQRVGPDGRAIGVDMTPEMLAKARKNAALYRQRTGLDNVEFRLGEIEHLPIADNSVDVVISNCVINLSPDKLQVWREIARVLRPGGRVAVADIALVRPLPPRVEAMVAALVGCIAGAVLVEETERMVRQAGLSQIVLERKPEAILAMAQSLDSLYQEVLAVLPAGERVENYITSLSVTATKTRRRCCG